MSQDNFNIKLDEVLTKQMTVNENLSQEIIVTTTDKVNILLTEHHKIIKKKSDWWTPVGIFATIIATLLTAKFEKEVFGVSAVMWQAIFVCSCIASFAYSAYLIFYAIKYYKSGSVEEFISNLKNRQATPQQLKTTGITIHSAQYFSGAHSIDITQQISAKVAAGDFSLTATNELWKDPLPGEPKTLRVKYSVDGKDKQLDISEGSTKNLK
jgi:hypothetical protein